MIKLYRQGCIISLLAVLNGCSMAPDYRQPSLPTADHYFNTDTSYPDTKSKRTAATTSWQHFYQQPELKELIKSALSNNRDLRLAILNIQQARLVYNVQDNQLLPTINATAGFSRQRISKETNLPGIPLLSSEYQIGVGITAFELDLFGRVASLNDEALATYFSIEETARAAKISLIAAVAHAYFNERARAAQLDLSSQALAASHKAFKIAQQQYKLGHIALDNLQVQQGRLYQRQIQASEMKRLHAQAYNALVMVVGQPILPKLRTCFTNLKALHDGFFAGLPSDLLLTRPDVRAAEQQLKSANAHIGAAEAAFFPRISITTLLGTASPTLSHLFSSDTQTWNFSPSLTIPIFDWGNNRDNLDIAKARTQISVATYEKAIQTAFKEVVDSLAARAAYFEQLRYQQGYVDTITTQVRLTQQKYRHGMASYLDVLNSLQELYATQQDFIGYQQARMDSAVDLFKALGGGLVP